jgi:ATP:ADP antiporter, AAA family
VVARRAPSWAPIAPPRRSAIPPSAPPDPPARASAARDAVHRLLAPLVAVRREEIGVLLLGTAYLFFAFASWYVLRPIRDEIGIAGGLDDLKWLFTGTLVATLALQPFWGAAVARWPRRTVIAAAYRVFALLWIGFYAALRLAGAETPAQLWVGRAFWVAATVFALFVVSVFWSLLADVLRDDAGKRLFGFLAAGGTLGAVVGGATTALLVEALGSAPLLLVSAALLEVAARCARAVSRRAGAELPGQERAERQPVGGGWLTGIRHVAASPYLLGIAGFLLLYTIGSTFLYFLQARIVEDAFADREARTVFFAQVDILVNVVTLVLQTGVTGRLLARLGVPATLAILPALSIAGFVALGLAPTLGVLVAFQAARRATNFAVARPARELLYVPLSREDKYKSKNFLDTTVYRFGDQVGAWSDAGLAALGLGLAGLAAAAAPLAAVWLALAVWLGRRHRRLADAEDAEPSAPAVPLSLRR